MQLQQLTRQVVFCLMTIGGVANVELAMAQPLTDSQGYVDGIAAVVNQDVITLRQVNAEVAEVTKNLRAQKIPVPDEEILQRQVLQRLIDERLIRQEALHMGFNPDQIDPLEAAELIANRNQMSLAQLRQEIEKGGLQWETYLRSLRQEVLIDRIRQQVIDPRISISDSEIDALLKSQGIDPASTKQPAQANEILEVAQILVRIPEGASQATQAELKQKAESLLRQVRSGADFAGVAAASSDGPEALQGGVLGARPLEGWPDVFASALKDTATGQVTDVVRSGAGYHILKVLNRSQAGNAQSAEADFLVTQTRASHILIKFNQITSDEQAKERIDQIAYRLRNGENFEELARAYSEDASAPQGGSLGWLNPGETVPAFEQAMDALAVGQVSAPIRSQFGWHIIRVDERRDRNVGNEFRRMQARQMLHQQRVEPAFDDWLSQIRSQAYIDNRLDPELSSGRRK